MENIKEVAEICSESYIYCAVMPFPRIEGIPDEWYENQKNGQLEFRKYVNKGYDSEKGPYTKWMATPMLYFPHESKKFPEFEMDDMDVLMLWMEVIRRGGVVSDGILPLFGDN